MGFPSGLSGKESACNAGDPGSIPGWGRSPGEGNSNPLEYSCLEKLMDREAWLATVHGVARELDKIYPLSKRGFYNDFCKFNRGLRRLNNTLAKFCSPAQKVIF